MSTVGVLRMPQQRGGLGKGRPSEHGIAMIGKNVVLPPKWWDRIAEIAEQKTATNPKGRKVSQADVIRDWIEDDVKGIEIEAKTRLPLLGVIYGGPAQRVESVGDNATIEVPFNVPANAYSLLVVGDSMESEDGVSIASGHYAIFEPTPDASYGSLVHVEWEDDKGESFCTFKKYVPQSDGGAIFRPLNGKHKPIKRAANTFQIKGKFIRPWDGKNG